MQVIILFFLLFSFFLGWRLTVEIFGVVSLLFLLIILYFMVKESWIIPKIILPIKRSRAIASIDRCPICEEQINLHDDPGAVFKWTHANMTRGQLIDFINKETNIELIESIIGMQSSGLAHYNYEKTDEFGNWNGREDVIKKISHDYYKHSDRAWWGYHD